MPRLLTFGILAVTLITAVAAPAEAHREDEYLQAATIEIEMDHVHLDLRLTPGTEIFDVIFAAIDGDGDGVLSADEEAAYVELLLGDLSLSLDGDPLVARATAWRFSDVAIMREGLGGLDLEIEAAVPAGGADRSLSFENRHRTDLSVYLVNALVPADAAIHIVNQARNVDQSSYRLDYHVDGGAGESASVVAFGVGGSATAALLIVLVVAVRRRRSRRAARAAA